MFPFLPYEIVETLIKRGSDGMVTGFIRFITLEYQIPNGIVELTVVFELNPALPLTTGKHQMISLLEESSRHQSNLHNYMKYI